MQQPKDFYVLKKPRKTESLPSGALSTGVVQEPGLPNPTVARYLPVSPMPSRPLGPQGSFLHLNNPGLGSSSGLPGPLVSPGPSAPTVPIAFSGPSGFRGTSDPSTLSLIPELKIPQGPHPSQNPQGSHPSQNSQGLHPSPNPQGPHPSQNPQGPHPSQNPQGPHPSQNPQGPHPYQNPQGPHPSQDPQGAQSSQAPQVGPPAFSPHTKPYKYRKERTVYTPEQQRQLEELFAKTKNPTREQKEELAHRINVTEENVKVWFKNRRSRSRREQRAAQHDGKPTSTFSSPGTSPFSGSTTSSEQDQCPVDAAAAFQGSEGFQVPAQDPSGVFPAGGSNLSSFTSSVSGCGTSPFSGSTTSSEQDQCPVDAASVLQGSEGFQDPAQDTSGVFPAGACNFSSFSSYDQTWVTTRVLQPMGHPTLDPAEPPNPAEPQDNFFPDRLSDQFLSGLPPDSPKFRHLSASREVCPDSYH